MKAIDQGADKTPNAFRIYGRAGGRNLSQLAMR
jgi:hypothetical protein